MCIRNDFFNSTILPVKYFHAAIILPSTHQLVLIQLADICMIVTIYFLYLLDQITILPVPDTNSMIITSRGYNIFFNFDYSPYCRRMPSTHCPQWLVIAYLAYSNCKRRNLPSKCKHLIIEGCNCINWAIFLLNLLEF